MKNKYLIRMNEPEDCVRVSDKDGIYYRLFCEPVTGHQKNEIDCMQFHEPVEKMIEYHEHTYGTETFFVSQGKIYCYCMGRGFTMSPGDVFHVQPWMGHSFMPIEPESRLNIMFMGIDQQAAVTRPWQHLLYNFPDVYADAEFREKFHTAGGYNTNRRSVPLSKEDQGDTVTHLRRAGFGICEHEFPGIKLQLKVARYETFGVKEVWELFMEPGFYCEWYDFLPEYRVFYVTQGKLHCTVKTSATEVLEFDAERDNIIYIPPYTPFRFDVTEQAFVYDMDCGARLQDLCEELEVVRGTDAIKFSNKSVRSDLYAQYGFNCTDVGFNK